MIVISEKIGSNDEITPTTLSWIWNAPATCAGDRRGVGDRFSHGRGPGPHGIHVRTGKAALGKQCYGQCLQSKPGAHKHLHGQRLSDQAAMKYPPCSPQRPTKAWTWLICCFESRSSTVMLSPVGAQRSFSLNDDSNARECYSLEPSRMLQFGTVPNVTGWSSVSAVY